MSEQGIVGLLTPKTQEGVEKLKTSTGYDLSKVNLNEGELKRLQAYQGFVRVVKDVLTTVVLNEGLDEPTRAKYNAALKEADEFLTHLEVRTLGVTFFRSLYKSAARLVEEQRTLAGSSNERAGLLEVQLAELAGKYEAIEAQYGADREAWATKEQGYQQELAQKDKAYRVLQEGKDVLQEMANTLARANNDLRNESARKDNLIYELGQARERDAANLAQAERDLEARVGQEKTNTRAAEDKINKVVEALKQTLKDKYGLTDEELADAAKDKDPAEFYLGLLNEKIAQDKSSIQAVEARLEEERRQRADNYKSAVEGQPVEPGQDDLSQVLVEKDTPAPIVEQITEAPAEPHDDAEEVRQITERTLDRFQEVAGLPARTLDEVTAGLADGTNSVEASEPAEEEHVVDVILSEPVVPVAKATTPTEKSFDTDQGLEDPELNLAAAIGLSQEELDMATAQETIVVEETPEPVAPVTPEPDLEDAFAESLPEAGSPAPGAQELDLADTFAESLPEGVAQPPAVPKEVDLVDAFGDSVPVEEPK